MQVGGVYAVEAGANLLKHNIDGRSAHHDNPPKPDVLSVTLGIGLPIPTRMKPTGTPRGEVAGKVRPTVPVSVNPGPLASNEAPVPLDSSLQLRSGVHDDL